MLVFVDAGVCGCGGVEVEGLPGEDEGVGGVGGFVGCDCAG